MANLNRVFLIGNLTRDPELRYTPSGTAVASFSIAMNRVYKLPSGEKKEEASFVRIVAWARTAEICNEYLKKGNPVFVEGRLQSRSWEAQDGQKRNTIEVIASAVQFLGGRPQSGQTDHRESSQKQSFAEPLEEISLDMPPEGMKETDGSKKDEVPF